MSHSAEAALHYHDRRWRQHREYEERVQAAVFKWWWPQCTGLGVPDYRLLSAQGQWLGTVRQSAFFILRRLHELGWVSEGPRMTLFVARGGFHGLMIWLKAPDARESPEEASMKARMLEEGYEVATALSAETAIATIATYLGSTISD